MESAGVDLSSELQSREWSASFRSSRALLGRYPANPLVENLPEQLMQRVLETALRQLAQRDGSDIRHGLPEMLSRSLHAIRTHLGMEVAFISEFADDRRFFRYVDSADQEAVIRVGDSNPLEESYCQRVVDGRLPELLLDACQNSEALTLPATRALPVGAHLSVPIVVSGHVFGTFCCFSTKPDHSLTPRDLATMRVFADMVADQIERELSERACNSAIEKRIDEAMRPGGMRSVYQPITDIRGSCITGFEALSRFDHPAGFSPDIWFRDAAKVGRGAELEQYAIRLALHALPALPRDIYLSVNASPEAIVTGHLTDVFRDVALDRVVLEVTEHEEVDQYTEIAKVLKRLRHRGLRVAIDDAGAGYACFKHILNLSPDIIKLDITITRNIDTDPNRRALAAALHSFATATNSKIVAEGVETVTELATLRALKIDMAQGYFLGRPGSLSEALSKLYTATNSSPYEPQQLTKATSVLRT